MHKPRFIVAVVVYLLVMLAIGAVGVIGMRTDHAGAPRPAYSR